MWRGTRIADLLSVSITGPTGFTGTRVVRHLHTAGHRVTGLDHTPPKDPLSEGVAFHVRDICQRELPDITFDAVVHLAALAGVRPSMGRPLECPESANVNGADPAGSQARTERKILVSGILVAPTRVMMLHQSMDTLSPHRSFTNLDDVRGIPQVLKSTPVPHRDHPLPGTKAMLYPQDAHFQELVTGHPTDDAKPSRTATVLGIIAMAAALGAIALFWYLALTGPAYSDKLEVWLFFPALAVVHGCGLFSHICSNGGTRLGNSAILVFWAGLFLSGIVQSFLH